MTNIVSKCKNHLPTQSVEESHKILAGIQVYPPYFNEVDSVGFLHINCVFPCPFICLCYAYLHFSQQGSASLHHLQA